jgi:hypothetical protein
MNDSLATKSDLANLRGQFAEQLGLVTRELTEHRRQLQDNEEAHKAERAASDEKWRIAAQATAVKTRLWVAAMTTAGLILVAIIQVVSNHSFAAACEQMREVNRQDRIRNEPAQTAHDELLVKRVLDERDRRLDQLIVKGLQK